jgi:hypothetical protein
LSYYLAQPILDLANPPTTNVWGDYFPDLLMAEAGMVLAGFLHDEKALGLFSNLRQTELVRMVTGDTAAVEANRPRRLRGISYAT